MKLRPLVLCMTAATLAGGCVTPVPQVLDRDLVPEAFAGQLSGAAQETWPAADWWQGFGSTELSDLIATAHAENRDLAVATARLAQARAQLRIERAPLFPKLSLQGETQRFVTPSTDASSNSYGLSLMASYELDFWGFQYSSQRAARELLKSSSFARQSTALTITADVANAYFSLLALRDRIVLAKEDIAAVQNILDVIKLKVTAGVSSRLDLEQEVAQMETLQSQLALLEQEELRARVVLALLVGRQLQQIEVKAQSLETVQPPPVHSGLASELLLRRPDVAQAEAALAAAHARVDAARAALLPRFALTANGAYTSSAFQTLLRSPNLAWDAGASLLQTIFAGGTLVGEKRFAEATQMEFIASYQRAVLTAYADVEIALGEIRNFGRAQEHLRRQADAAREAFRIAQLQYVQGTADLIVVLQTQLTLFAAKDELTQMTLAYLQATVHLYRSLGGGWQEQPDERTQLTIVDSPPDR